MSRYSCLAAIGFLLISALVGVPACERATPDQPKNERTSPPPKLLTVPYSYGFARENSSWNPEVWANGQPALRFEGSHSGFWGIDRFVIDGGNEVKVTAVRNTEHTFGPDHRGECSLKLIRQKYGFADLTVLHSMTEPENSDRDELSFEFSFTAEVPVRWRWQDSDDLGELTQADRESMLELFHQLVDAYKSNNPDAVCALVSPFCPGDTRVGLEGEIPTQDLRAAVASHVSLLKDHQLIIAPDAEIRFVSGTKVVMMFVPGTEERWAGRARRALIAAPRLVEIGTNQPPGSEWDIRVETVFDSLHVIRVEGAWHLIGFE